MVERLTTRIGATTLVLGLVLLAISQVWHPSHENPMDNPAVFREYAQSHDWTTIHLVEYAGYLLLLGGLVAMFYAVAVRPDVGAAVARFGLAAAVTSAAAFTILQAVDGVALKRAVDAWASAPADRQAAAFAAAEAVRWIEIGVNGLANILVGATLILFGVALALGRVYPRWLGGLAAVAGLGRLIHGGVVSYRGFVASISGLVGLVLLAIWVCTMAVLLWRHGSRPAEGEAPSLRP